MSYSKAINEATKDVKIRPTKQKKYYAVYWVRRGREVFEDFYLTKKEAVRYIENEIGWGSDEKFIIRELIPGRIVK